ncbi:serine threonine-protein kinase smg1 [Hordeum vulgare]|nr:serine threonine-protein kinase smg1 [Hordeum vulgare]
MIALASNKNNSNINHWVMSQFWRFTADEELHDMYLHRCRYCWSSECDMPTFVRNDRIMCTSRQEIAKPECVLQCLSSLASDHCPLVVDCIARPPGARRFHFKPFWVKVEGFHLVVSEAWNSLAPKDDPFRRIVSRLKTTV